MTRVLRTALRCLAVASACAAAAHARDPRIDDALRREDVRRAEQLAREGLAANGGEDAEALDAVDALVDVLLDADRPDAPELDGLLRRETALALRLGGGDSPVHARASLRQAQLQLARRDYPAFARSLDAAVAASGCDESRDDATCAEIDLLGGLSLFYVQRQPARGAARVQARLERLRADASADPRLVSRALRLHARLQFDSQHLDTALPAMQAWEAHARATFGERSAHRSDALTWLGFTLRESGRYAEGIEALREGAAIAATLDPYRQRLHVDALIALAQNLDIIGDRDQARAEFERALAIEERKPTANGYLLGLLYSSLGTLHGNAGEAAAAYGYITRAVPVYERVFGTGSPRTMLMRGRLAATLIALGRYDEAAPIYDGLIAAIERDPQAQAGASMLVPYRDFATMRLWQHRYADAERLLRRYLALLGEGTDFREVNPRGATAELAAALWGQGRHAEAFAEAERAHRIVARTHRNAIDQLSEREMLSFDRRQPDTDGLAVAIAAAGGDRTLAERAWNLQIESSGRVTRTVAARLARSHARDGDAALWSAWREAQAALATARVRASRDPGAAAIAAVDRAQERADAIERRIARAGDPSLATLQADLAAVRAALPEDALLVRFLEITDYAPDRLQRPAADAGARLYALAARRGGAVRIVDLGALPPLRAAIDDWHRLAADTRGDTAATDAAAKALRRALYDPLSDAADRRWFVVPSAALTRLNLAALVDERGNPLLDAGPAFHLLNHERELLLPAPSAAAPNVLLAGAAQHGDPAPATAMRATCPTLDAHLAESLPGARREIAALRGIAAQRSDRVRLLEGTAATESAVRAAMPGQSIVHLATHAFAYADGCSDAGANRRAIGLDVPASADVRERIADLAALAFLPQSGAGEASDGLLTAEEIATLDLSGTDWVVLSACETALGSERGGEGVFGLRRAFRLAGARTVVMSVWKVEDEATAEFMQALYRARLVEGLDTPAAMRSAMQATREARRARGQSTHPLYWAGFVAAGGWR